MKDNIISTIISQGILPLYFHKSEEVSTEVLRALYNAGIRIVEYTNRGPEAFRNFEKIKRAATTDMPDMLLGLGTVLEVSDARTAVNIGADFIISPGFSDDIEGYIKKNQVIWIPGCMTPTEIMRAMSAGIRMVKLFPGNLLGPSFVKSVREVFPDMLFLPTGGVAPQKENLAEWFAAGVSAVGMGSTLISKSILEQKDYAAIARRTLEITALIREIRKDQK